VWDVCIYLRGGWQGRGAGSEATAERVETALEQVFLWNGVGLRARVPPISEVRGKNLAPRQPRKRAADDGLCFCVLFWLSNQVSYRHCIDTGVQGCQGSHDLVACRDSCARLYVVGSGSV